VGHRSGVYQISFSPDGRYILSTSDDKTARLWEVNSGKEVVNIKHDSPVWTGDFSPDGNMIATGSDDSTIHIWKLAHEDGGPRLYNFAVLRIFDGPVWDLAFKQSAGGLLVAAGGVDRLIRVLNLSLFEKFSARPDVLEREAEERGGLTVQLNGSEPEIVPIPPNRSVPATTVSAVGVRNHGSIQ
jgi:WD40 repeat protein